MTRAGAIAIAEMLDRVLDQVAADTEALACADEVKRCRAIIAEGTSADEQLRIFDENEHEGAEIAVQRVARWIAEATLMA